MCLQRHSENTIFSKTKRKRKKNTNLPCHPYNLLLLDRLQKVYLNLIVRRIIENHPSWPKNFCRFWIIYTCLVPWGRGVCGPCGWGRHIGRGRGEAPQQWQRASVSYRHSRREDVTHGERWESEWGRKKTTPSWLKIASMHRVSVDVHSWRIKNKFIVM